jgi:hypothetical protein
MSGADESPAQAILEHLRLFSRPLPLAPATFPPVGQRPESYSLRESKAYNVAIGSN